VFTPYFVNILKLWNVHIKQTLNLIFVILLKLINKFCNIQRFLKINLLHFQASLTTCNLCTYAAFFWTGNFVIAPDPSITRINVTMIITFSWNQNNANIEHLVENFSALSNTYRNVLVVRTVFVDLYNPLSTFSEDYIFRERSLNG
jgi:hypothetical protein